MLIGSVKPIKYDTPLLERKPRSCLEPPAPSVRINTLRPGLLGLIPGTCFNAERMTVS